jgi:hypothetical protein
MRHHRSRSLRSTSVPGTLTALLFALSVTLTACGGSEAPTRGDIDDSPGDTTDNPQPAEPEVLRVGTFQGLNDYVTVGTAQIVRDPETGVQSLRTLMDFRVSGGAGSVSVWLTDANGRLNLGGSALRHRGAPLTSDFDGAFTWPAPAGAAGTYTHVITYCDAARVNFGWTELRVPTLPASVP